MSRKSGAVSDEAIFVPVILKSSCPLALSPATVTEVMSPAVPLSPERIRVVPGRRSRHEDERSHQRRRDRPLLFFRRDATAGRGRRNCVDMPVPPSIAGPRSAGPDPTSNRTHPIPRVSGRRYKSYTWRVAGRNKAKSGGSLAETRRSPSPRARAPGTEPRGRAALVDAHPNRARPADLTSECPSCRSRGAPRRPLRHRNRRREPEIPVKERCDLRGPRCALWRRNFARIDLLRLRPHARPRP